MKTRLNNDLIKNSEYDNSAVLLGGWERQLTFSDSLTAHDELTLNDGF